MKSILISLFGAAMFLVASPALAQLSVDEVQEFMDDELNQDCAKAVAKAVGAVGKPWKDMRSACANLRSCKKTCRQAKKGVKQEARGDKKDCKQECKDLKGKAKNDCNKSCNQDFRADKKDARGATRNCKTECRAEFKTPACRQARQKVWVESLKGAGKALGPCAKAVEQAFNNE